ncbi:hypothetical protein H4317_10925 [Hymenobacter sediminicola]|uniref:Uncharacterized protein n=1 Tax=Hymenobacter sediminicola TaxID=2761579 RepID=A0A7G7W2W4_9BACT|nr:hypothetical protein H4317_10925 [Hymenobacter sediminicola]
MKKIYLSCVALALSAGFAEAGRLQNVVLGGAPRITILGGYQQAGPLQATFTITNNNTRSLQLGLQRQIISEVSGTENNFCFGTGCYPPSVTTAPSPITVAAGAVDNTFLGDYVTNGRAGITTIRYAVYEVGTQDSTYVTVVYDASRPLKTSPMAASEQVLSQPAPNPAAGGAAFRLTYSLPSHVRQAHLVLVSLTDGRRVYDLPLQSANTFSGILAGGCIVDKAGVITISTVGLARGLYSCLLIADDRSTPLAARRLLVQ